MFLGRKFVAIFLVAILSILAVMPAYAANERVHSDDEIIDDLDDQEYYWEQIDGTWICTDGFGEPVTGWATREGHKYFLNKNGEMRTGWIKTQGKWYYLYTAEDVKDKKVDKALVGTMAKDTWIDNYYVDEDGVQKKIKK